MPVELNHTIVWCRDKARSAGFLAYLLGRPQPAAVGPFLGVTLDNDVSLDFAETDGAPSPQHYAFLVSEAEFDRIFARIEADKIAYWANPYRKKPNAINRRDGGRGVYFEDPDGHVLELLTRPYGSGGG